MFNAYLSCGNPIRLPENVAKKRKDRRGRRGFLWNMPQFFDFARFLFHHMIAFVGPAHSRDSGVDRAGHATPSAPARYAIDVSHAIIKFRFCMTAAVSTNASAPASNTSPGTINPGKNSSCAKASIIFMLTSRTPSVRARFVKQSERDRTCRVGFARSDCRAAKYRLMTMPLPLGYQSFNRERYGSLTAKLRTNLLSRTQRFASSPFAV
jgi:hypothetical protein